MALTFKKLHPHFVAEVSGANLRQVQDGETLNQLRAGMDEYAVLVFHNQTLTNDEHLAFAQRLDGAVNVNSASTIVLQGKNRFPPGLADVSNINEKGEIWAPDDRKRMSRMNNRYWHTDQSYQDPAGRYSMLSAKVIPPVSADTEWADMRAAYDALDDGMKKEVAGLRVFHSTAHSKQMLGFELSPEEKDKLKGTVHPLVRVNPRSQRRSLYLALHASHIVDWPVPDGRLLLHDLTEHATQQQFVYRHAWRVDDFIIWDNRATMHRGRRYDDLKYRRELVRVTTLDTPLSTVN